MSLPGKWYVDCDSNVQGSRLVNAGEFRECLALVYRTEGQWRWTWIGLVRGGGHGGEADSRAEAMNAVRDVQRRLGKEARDAR